MFVHENYHLIKKEQGELTSREIISMLARQWGTTTDEEKQIWKLRADHARNEPFPTIPGLMPDDPDEDDETSDEDFGIEDETGGRKRRALRRHPIASSTSV